MLPLAGLAVAGLAIGYAEATGKGSDQVPFSGQSALGPQVQNSAMYTVWALLALIAVLLATVLLFSDGLAVTRIAPADSEDPDASRSPAPPVRAGPGTTKG